MYICIWKYVVFATVCESYLSKAIFHFILFLFSSIQSFLSLSFFSFSFSLPFPSFSPSFFPSKLFSLSYLFSFCLHCSLLSALLTIYFFSLSIDLSILPLLYASTFHSLSLNSFLLPPPFFLNVYMYLC